MEGRNAEDLIRGNLIRRKRAKPDKVDAIFARARIRISPDVEAASET